METVKTKLFEYGVKETEYLIKADPLLGDEIVRLGKIERIIIPELFPALVYAIIGQQISSKASKTIWERVQERFLEISPANLTKIPIEDIRLCGIPQSKAGYIKEIARKITKGEFDLNVLYKLSDKEVIKSLSSLSGIGMWTAETLLLNSMERPNIISYGDISIRRGLMKLYSLTELKKEQFTVYKNRYSPYASVASLYIWKLAHE